MATDYYLHIEAFTQSQSANGKEAPVDLSKIDSDLFLHIYVSGAIPSGSKLRISKIELPSGGTFTFPQAATKSGAYYKFTITHYILKNGTRYRMRSFDRMPKNPNSKPNCVASRDIKTL